MGGVRKLLEDLHFVGYSNFDVKYDERDGSFKFFDFNTRQGRSNYYVTNSGFNVAKYVVDEYVFNRPFEPEFVTAGRGAVDGRSHGRRRQVRQGSRAAR